MPTREKQERLATNNLLVALNDARTGIGIESLRLVVDGFRVLFRKGPLTHLVRGAAVPGRYRKRNHLFTVVHI